LKTIISNRMYIVPMACFLVLSSLGQAQITSPLKTDIDGKTLIYKLERTIPDLMKKGRVPGLSSRAFDCSDPGREDLVGRRIRYEKYKNRRACG